MHDDITQERLAEVDKSDMMGTVLGVPEQLKRAIGAARDIEFSPPRPVKRVLVTGLGGSAMGGNLVAEWTERAGTAPVVVNRGYHAPKWVDEDTLVIAVSYSGNTEETLAAFVESKRRGAMLAAVATGGKLEEFATKAKAPFVKIESGLQPRAALPRTFVPQAALLGAAGVLPDVFPELDAAADALVPLAKDLAPDAPPAQNEAKRIAYAIKDSVPVVYGADHLGQVSRRWANNFNENSKVLSFWGIMPEMNHNELVGWAGDDDLDRFTAIFLRHDEEHPQVKDRFAFTRSLVQERGGRVVQVDAKAKGFAPSTFATGLIGDAASVYLAILRDQDPTPVDVIARLKGKVGETGFADELAKQL